MSRVVVVASFKAREGREDDLLAGLDTLATSTHAEAGCLNYALHRDAADPGVFVLVEQWTSQVALDAHFQQPYVQGLGEQAAELLAEPPVLRFCTPVPVGDPVKGVL